MDTPPLSSADVAALFRMSERAIRLWAAKGEIPHLRTLGGGRLLYPADAIATLFAQLYPDALSGGWNRSRTPGGTTRKHAS